MGGGHVSVLILPPPIRTYIVNTIHQLNALFMPISAININLLLVIMD